MNTNAKNFKAKAVRTVTSPSNEEITTYFTWVEFQDLPIDIPMEVNPRKPKMNTSVAKQLIRAVESSETDFDINNRGIVITAKSFKFNSSTSVVDLDLGDDTNKYGILDGGHTYTAIIQHRQRLVQENIQKFVKLEVVIGENLDTSALADARNTSAQVSDIALFELDNKFDIVKNSLSNESYKDDIAYKDNENKRIPIVEAIRLMFAFNIDKFPDDSAVPVASYSGKATVFKDYKNCYGKEDNIYTKLAVQLPKLVELYEKIQEELPQKYREYKGNEGKKGHFGKIKGISPQGSYKSLFSEKTIQHEIPTGFLMPIFGAFRTLIKEEKGHLTWEFDPIEVWNQIGTSIVQNTFDTDTNPQLAGKSRTLWQANYRIVENVKTKMLLEKLMRERQ